MSGVIHVTISAKTDPRFRLRDPFTGDQEQMLRDMRQVEALPRDPFDRVAMLVRQQAARSRLHRMRR